MKKRLFNRLPEIIKTLVQMQGSNSPLTATYATTATKQTLSQAKRTRKEDSGKEWVKLPPSDLNWQEEATQVTQLSKAQAR